MKQFFMRISKMYVFSCKNHAHRRPKPLKIVALLNNFGYFWEQSYHNLPIQQRPNLSQFSVVLQPNILAIRPQSLLKYNKLKGKLVFKQNLQYSEYLLFKFAITKNLTRNAAIWRRCCCFSRVTSPFRI